MQQLAYPASSHRVRAANMLFSHWRLAAVVFALVFAAAAALALFSPNQYQCRMKILVKNERVTPLVGIDDHTTSLVYQDQISEGRINSEIQLLTSSDLLRGVVQRTDSLLGKNGRNMPEGKALRALQRSLLVRSINRSNVIEVLYTSSNPHTSLAVLDNLSNLYLDSHIKVNGSMETRDFFEKQAADYEQKLSRAQAELTEFRRQNHVVALGEEKNAALQQVSALEKEALDTDATSEQEARQIDVLKEQVAQLQPRITKEIRNLSNQYSVERLNTLLVELRNKRTMLASRYRSDDRTIVELDQQIGDTERALSDVAKSNAIENTTDVNPLFQSTAAELGKTEANFAGTTARGRVLNRERMESRTRLIHLDQISSIDERLTREVKGLEDAFSSYVQKRDQARAGEALDRRRVTNVAIVETPFLPDTASSPNRPLIFAWIRLGLLDDVGSHYCGVENDRYALEPGRARTENRLTCTGNRSVPGFTCFPDWIGRNRSVGRLRMGVSNILEMEGLRVQPGAAVLPEIELSHEGELIRVSRYSELISVAFSGSTGKPRVVAFTSPEPGTGVSFVSSGVARELAQTLQGSVLLVEAGILEAFMSEGHRDVLAVLNANRDGNLSTVKAPAFRAKKKMYAAPPARSMVEVLDILRCEFRYIVVDTPSLPKSDLALRHASIFDAIALVVQAGKTGKSAIGITCRRLQTAKGNLVGLICNKRKYPIPSWLYKRLY
jgi:uncharacterized protein involved in exopolysaccharide biosynthesis